MAIALMIISISISVMFLVDFTKTIFELQEDREALKNMKQGINGFSV